MVKIINSHMTILKVLNTTRMIFLIMFLVLLVVVNLSDPDYYWHIKTGEQILLQGSLPDFDMFSFTNADRPWVLHEWLFQVMLFKVYELLGAAGIKVMTAVMGMLALCFSYLAVSRISGKPVVSTLLVLAFYLAIVPFISPRPQLASFVFFAITMFLLMQFKYLKNRGQLIAMPVVMILWVNMHGGYIVGVALLLLFTLCELMTYWMGEKSDNIYRKELSKLVLITSVTILSSALNPDFFSHWLYPITVMSMEAPRFISEWSSPNFHHLFPRYSLLLILLFFVLYFYRKIKPDLTELILPLFFVTTGFVAYRHMPIAFLTLIPFAGIAVSKGAGEALAESWIGKLYRKHVTSGTQLGNREYLLNWGVTAVIALLCMLVYPAVEQVHQSRRDMMVAEKATEFIVKTGISGRMFNTYRFGGYLIYRLYPAQRVFIDGRADMYGDEFIQEYRRIKNGWHGWEEAFEKYDIDYVICTRDAPIRQLLLVRGDFRLVYDDENNSVLLKNIPRHAALIASYGK